MSANLPRTREKTREQGFTLIEMLVALSLASILSVALFANVGMGARVWNIVEDHSQETASGNILYRVVRSHIELAVPVGITRGAARQQIYFEGRSQTLRFFTEAGAGAQPRGIYGVEFDLSGDQDQRILSVRRARVAIGGLRDGQTVAWDESRLPLQGDGAALAYYGRLDGDTEAEWHREWSGQRALPDLVRLSLGSNERAEAILIAPRLDFSAAKLGVGQFDRYFVNIQG